jgi:phosphoglucomutase
LAEKNGGEAAEGFTGVASIVKSHWNEYGRNFYSRYDYEDVNAEKATQVGDLQVIRAAFAPLVVMTEFVQHELRVLLPSVPFLCS